MLPTRSDFPLIVFFNCLIFRLITLWLCTWSTQMDSLSTTTDRIGQLTKSLKSSNYSSWNTTWGKRRAGGEIIDHYWYVYRFHCCSVAKFPNVFVFLVLKICDWEINRWHMTLLETSNRKNNFGCANLHLTWFLQICWSTIAFWRTIVEIAAFSLLIIVQKV